MTFALVLGGGGTVGVSWEVGVLAALADAGVRPSDAQLIVGSSAGSLVGTHIRQGRSIESLATQQRQPVDDGSGRRADADLSGVMEVFAVMSGAKERTPAVFQEVGRIAMAADTPPEAEWIGRFDKMIDSPDWPEDDLWLTAVDCNTGTRRAWTKADGVPLPAALASSCSIPGVFPPISLDGSRYTDGGLWSSSNLDIVLDAAIDAAIFVGPLRAGAKDAVRQLEREIELLAAHGTHAEAILPGEAFMTEIGMTNLMNAALRDRGLDLGIEDGSAAVERTLALLG